MPHNVYYVKSIPSVPIRRSGGRLLHLDQHLRREQPRIERVPREDAVLPHLASVGEPRAGFGSRGGSSGPVFRRQTERGEGAVVGDFLQRLGEPLEVLAAIDRGR